LSSRTCAYDDDGKKQHDFHEGKLHQGRRWAQWIAQTGLLRWIGVDSASYAARAAVWLCKNRNVF